jgi:signal transduction histidine kinase/CheY-like chemotaxis protein
MEERTIDSLQRELRQEFLSWTLLPYAAIGLVLIASDIQAPPPPSRSALGLFALAMAILAWVVKGRRPAAAAWVGHAGALFLTLVAWRWYPASPAYLFSTVPVVAVGLVLGGAACALIAGAATLMLALVLWLVPGIRADPVMVAVHLGTLWSVAFLILVSQRSQHTMIAWSWQGYAEARRNLEAARDRQVELKQALAELSRANNETIRLNRLLGVARQSLEEARRAKEEFVANVSHELRTPLNMIIGFSDMILRAPEVYSRRLPPALLADISAIKRNSTHLANLVDDVLDLAETETGRLRILREWVSLRDVVQEAAEAVSSLFEGKGLRLTTNVPEDLAVHCDRVRIRQVILNLLSNAGRFAEDGGAEVVAQADGPNVVVRVSDTGPGIARDKVNRLFEPFQQGDPSIRRRYGGTGLGLSISKRFVEMHGGRIWIESELGVGTTVAFCLPLYDTLMGAQDASRWLHPAQEEKGVRTRPSLVPLKEPASRILVVEEGRTLCRLISRYLEGFEPVPWSDLEGLGQAVESLAATAVVVNEGAMGKASEVVRMLPGSSFDIPIVSCWVPEDEENPAPSGTLGYLVKPVARDALLSAIHRVAPGARSILLADDDSEARQLFGRMLTSDGSGYSILQAEDGESTLRLLRERRPDLLLLDLVMPNGDGFSVLEAKMGDPDLIQIPVLVLSAKDPERELIVSQTLTVRRPGGLSAKDLMLSLEAITGALRPRFRAPGRPETTLASPASV